MPGPAGKDTVPVTSARTSFLFPNSPTTSNGELLVPYRGEFQHHIRATCAIGSGASQSCTGTCMIASRNFAPMLLDAQ